MVARHTETHPRDWVERSSIISHVHYLDCTLRSSGFSHSALNWTLLESNLGHCSGLVCIELDNVVTEMFSTGLQG